VNAIINQTTSLPVCSASSDPTTCFRPTQLGFPANFATPAAFKTTATQMRYIPNDNRDGYVQNWHFTIQQQLTKTLTVDLGYVGNHSVGLMILADVNQAAVNAKTATCNTTVSPNITSGCLSLQARRPYQKFAGIEIAYDGGFASYNAFQFKIEKRYSGGLYLLNSFVFSKGMDNASGHLEVQNGDSSKVNLAIVKLEKGLSSYDQTYNETASVIYDLPVGKGKRFNLGNSTMDYILGGWQMNFINTMTSGLPINLTYSASSAFQVSDLVSYRPNIVGALVMPESQQRTGSAYVQYLNPAGVSAPTDASQPFGNASRNPVRGYAFYQLDFGLHKDFPFPWEGKRMEFRFEAFNLLNKTNFSAPSSNIGSTYGRITSTYPARQLQFGLKVVF